MGAAHSLDNFRMLHENNWPLWLQFLAWGIRKRSTLIVTPHNFTYIIMTHTTTVVRLDGQDGVSPGPSTTLFLETLLSDVLSESKAHV